MSNNPESNNSSPASPDSKSEDSEKAGRGLRSLLWVIAILLIGTIVGIVSFLLVAPHIIFVGGSPFPFHISYGDFRWLSTFIAEHIILSTVSIALLASLLTVYARVFRQTRANFALGIFIVLLALLFEAILNYPILRLLTGPVPSSEFSSPLPTLADVFTVVAYTVFLYLSLE